MPKNYIENPLNLEILLIYSRESEKELIIEFLEDYKQFLKFISIKDFNILTISESTKIVIFGYVDEANIVEEIIKSIKQQFNQVYYFIPIKYVELNNYDKLIDDKNIDFIIYPINRLILEKRIFNILKLIKFENEWLKEKKHLEFLNREKNELLAIAAHDLKNPIFSIQLLAKTIRDDKSLTNEELYEFSDDIVSSSDRIIDIIKQLLDLNSIESGKINIDIAQVNIYEPIKHLIELYKFKSDRKNIKVNMDFESDGMAYTDSNAVKNIFDNFISNAIKYSPFNKSIYINIYDKDNFLVIDVIDEGPGIPEAELDKLFKRFAKISNKPTGGENSTGLGLSIVKKFVDLINAKVMFKNNDNIGSTFSVWIPKS